MSGARGDRTLEHWRGAAFDPSRSTHRGWLLMLTHRRAVDRVRYEQRRSCLLLEAVPERASTRRGPEELAVATVLAPRVRAAVGTLPRAQREVLALAYWGGYTHREIAKITRAPLGTVKTRMRNGLISLRKALADERNENPRRFRSPPHVIGCLPKDARGHPSAAPSTRGPRRGAAYAVT